MAKQTFTTGQVLTAAQMTSLQQTAMGGGSATAKTVSYTLVAADAGTVVAMNSASPTTVTVNTGLFAAGDSVQIQNLGAGVVTVTAGTATVSTSAVLTLKQYDGGTLYFVSTGAAIFFSADAADSPLTTKGDLYTYSTTNDRLAVGNNGETLLVDSSTSTGLKWAKSANFVGCSVNNSYVVINNATETKIPFNAEAFDTSGFHDNTTNNTRLTIPIGLGGKYQINVNAKFLRSSVGQRYVNILKNNSTTYQVICFLPSASYYVSDAASIILDLAAGDYLEYVAYQDSGAALEILVRTPFEEPFSIHYLGA